MKLLTEFCFVEDVDKTVIVAEPLVLPVRDVMFPEVEAAVVTIAVVDVGNGTDRHCSSSDPLLTQ